MSRSGDLMISNVRLSPANRADQARGLLAFVTVTINGLVIDGITVRKTLDDRVVLAFPKRRDRDGRQWSIVHPANQDMRTAITKRILGEIHLDAAARGGAR